MHITRALITGGAGFIGTHLGSRLAEDGVEVDIVDNFTRGVRDKTLEFLKRKANVRVIALDILDKDAVRALPNQYTHIFHLAAIIGVQNVLERPYAVLRDNLQMLVNMLDHAAKCGTLGRFVFTSTSEVYAGTLQHFTLPFPTPEATPLAIPDIAHPRTSYMLSKIYGEALCHHSGIPYTIFRPHNFFGPRMGLAHVIPELLERAVNSPSNSGIEVFSADHRRTFCFISDAIEAVLRATGSDRCIRETLNIGVESPEITMGELADLVLSIVGKGQHISPGASTPGSPARRCPSIAKARELIGFSPLVSLEEGIRRTYSWYLEHVFHKGAASAR